MSVTEVEERTLLGKSAVQKGMRGRGTKITLLVLGVLTACAIVWRFYDPMPDVPLPVRATMHQENYTTLMKEIAKYSTGRESQFQVISPKYRTAESIKVWKKALDTRITTLEKIRHLLDLPFDPPLPNPDYTSSELVSRIITVGICMDSKGVLCLLDKDIDQAYAWCFAAWRLGATTYLSGAIELEMVVGISVMRVARFALFECIKHAPPSQTEKYITYIEDYLIQTPDVATALAREEEEFKYRWLLRMKHPGWLSPPKPDESSGRYEPSFWDRMRTGFIKKRDFMDKGLAIRAEARTLIPNYYVSKLPSFTDRGDVGEKAAGLLAQPDAFFNSYFLDRAGNSMMLAYLGLEKYRHQKGSYPKKLEDLVPGILKSMPTDPFNRNQPLRYERIKNTFQLYSLGPDQIDDRGTPSVYAAAGPKRFDFVQAASTGDIVWGVNKI